MESDPSPLSDLQILQKQIKDLTEVYDKIQTLRQIPTSLLKSTSHEDQPGFHRLKEIGESIRSSSLQEALHRAQDSIGADATQINSNPRRESRKQRRPPSPASPQPYISKAPQEPTAFPPPSNNVQPLLGEDLASFIKEYNQERGTKLHIWQRAVDEPRTDRPKLLRFTIPDVVTVYISIGYQGPNGNILIENMTAFAPREKKAPHLQSEYTVFQTLSQQFARVLHSHSGIALQSLMVSCDYWIWTASDI
ncbi:hypothetical protein AN958_04699 [Leucoagaricus sp. SymC.cos]|nr:hypothetical protein AN958_04699 [Leucoagaricus sp. SymC.cos]